MTALQDRSARHNCFNAVRSVVWRNAFGRVPAVVSRRAKPCSAVVCVQFNNQYVPLVMTALLQLCSARCGSVTC